MNAVQQTVNDPRDLPALVVTGRSLHLVDVENLAGTPTLTRAAVADVQSRYLAVAQVADGDHVVIATSHHGAYQAWMGWGGNPRRRVGSGPDGADLCLLEVIEREGVAERFARVVIASGDGIFSVPAAQLQAAGVSVTVVSRPDALSRRLRFASRDIRILPPAEVRDGDGPVASVIPISGRID